MALNLDCFLFAGIELNFLHISTCDVHKKYNMCFISVLTLNVV